MTVAQTYERYQSMLFGLAYRMLGMAADAEDIVQDVFAQYMQVDSTGILNERAYLAKMTANRCINLLKSSRRKRETYVGSGCPNRCPVENRSPIRRSVATASVMRMLFCCKSLPLWRERSTF